MRLNIFNKKRYMKESEDKKTNRTPPGGVEDFVANLRKFMNNPPFRGNVGRSLQENDDYTVYVSYIKAIYELVEGKVKSSLGVNNGISLRIVNTPAKSTLTFKVFIHNGDLSNPSGLLKCGGKISFSFHEDIDAKSAPFYNIKIMLRDTGYGRSNIPNFYIQGEEMFAKANGELLKATEAAESLVALYFNKLNKDNETNFEEFNDSNLLTADNVLNAIPKGENIKDTDVKEAIKVICADRNWNLSCKANALGILKFLENQSKIHENIKKDMFTAKHPSWDGKREKNIVINEYLDPSDIFLVKEGDVIEDYKEKCKDNFNNPRTLGVSLKKLKLLTEETIKKDKPSEEVFKTPNFFLTGWKEETSPQVIYMESIPDNYNFENNYVISDILITVSNSRDSESGESGKTMYFYCKINEKEKKLLFTIRKDGGKNFVLESAGSDGTESQGGKCSKLISFVLGKEFEGIFNKASENFEPAQQEVKKGKKGNKKAIKDEIRNIEAVLQEIYKLKEKIYNVKNIDTVKRAAIAFAFAKKLPFFSKDHSVDKIVIEAFDKLGYNGDVYDKNSKNPIYLGLGKDAYYSGN